MKIVIDIGHPAHVHYFKNFIKIMKKKGHKFLIAARDKEVTFNLLNYIGEKYISKGKGSKNIFGKFLYMLKADTIILKHSIKFKPDIFISFSSPYAAQVSFLLGKTHIAFDDTENARFGQFMYIPFTNTILTPSCYSRNLNKRQIRFNGYMELCSLHPNYFSPCPSIWSLLGIPKKTKYVILRFVSWKAVHDIGHSGLHLEMKRKAVNEFSKHAKVFISSEGEMPDDLKQYKINIPPEMMHSVLFYSTLLYGESATMTSECAVLGTPAIFLNNKGLGYTNEEEIKFGLVYNFTESTKDQELSIKKAIELLKTPDVKKGWQKKKEKMLSEKIDVTAFLVWFIENYPESSKIMKETPDYQLNFK